ncbi:MAG: hypothetical protein ACKO83_06100, partial [Roseiflexaceae bacterium]
MWICIYSSNGSVVDARGLASPQNTVALGTSTLIINGGGGVNTAGTDGQKIIINAGGVGEQVRFANSPNYYGGADSSNVTFVLAVGSNSFGTIYATNNWTSK